MMSLSSKSAATPPSLGLSANLLSILAVPVSKSWMRIEQNRSQNRALWSPTGPRTVTSDSPEHSFKENKRPRVSPVSNHLPGQSVRDSGSRAAGGGRGLRCPKGWARSPIAPSALPAPALWEPSHPHSSPNTHPPCWVGQREGRHWRRGGRGRGGSKGEPDSKCLTGLTRPAAGKATHQGWLLAVRRPVRCSSC